MSSKINCKVTNITYEKLDTEYLEKLMVSQEPDMRPDQISDAMRCVSCGITIKKDGVRAGVAYLSTGGGQIFLDGYKDGSVRVGIRVSIDAGKALVELAKKAGYEHILSVFKSDRKDIARLLKAIGFTKTGAMRDDYIYKMQLKSVIIGG